MFYIFPALWAVRISFTDLALTGAKALNYTFVGLKEYQRLFSNPDFYGALGRTVIFTVGTCVGQFAIGLIAALLLSRKRLFGQGLLMSVDYSAAGRSLADSGAALAKHAGVGRIWHAQPHPRHRRHSPIEWVRDFPMLSVILVNFWNNSGFAMILFLAGLENIPAEILESAQIDGANGFQTLRFIKLPLIRYVLLLWLLLNTLGCLNTFDLVYALTRGGPGRRNDDHGHFHVQPGLPLF